MNYKALSRTSSLRKRVPRVRPPAERPTRTPLEGKVLARELHDSVAQTLSAMLMDLESFRTEQHGRAGVLRQMDLLERSTRKALSDLRRLLGELRAQQVGEMDLVELVRHGMVERQGGGHLPEFGLTVAPDWPQHIQGTAALELHRMVAEAIENGIRHAHAKRIEVSLGVSPGVPLAVMTISDDGYGLFKPEDFDRNRGLGILGMRERAALLGAEVEFRRGPDGLGTTVRITVPLSALTCARPNA